MPAWLIFALSAGAVAVAGTKLATAGDTIGEGTGLGGLWVGALLIAAVTSLPELATDLAAVLQHHPGLAVGDLFGSCMANMMILAVADLLTRESRMLSRVAVNQVLVGTLGISLTIIAVIGVMVGGDYSFMGLGWPTAAIAVAYVAGMRLIHHNREGPPFQSPSEVSKARVPKEKMQSAVIVFGVATIAILVAAPYLASSSSALADQLGISQGFAGMLLLALTTSLPEAAVSYGSIRSGAYALCVGNLLGSNCFNMAAMIPLDLAHGGESLLASVEPSLALGGLFACLLTALAMLDVLNKSERHFWVVELGPVVMLFVYVAGLVLTYQAGSL